MSAKLVSFFISLMVICTLDGFEEEVFEEERNKNEKENSRGIARN